MPCEVLSFTYPLVGIAQRALIAGMRECGVFMVSHVSPGVIELIERMASVSGARYAVIYAKLTGTPRRQSLRHGVLVHANHHEKYYLVDGVFFATGKANLTDTEFNDETINSLILYKCSSPDDLMGIREYQLFLRELRIALSKVSVAALDALRRVLNGTPCSIVLSQSA